MIQWVVIAYVLTQTSLMLSFGRIGDMLGYRRIFLFGTGISTVAFIACALAPSFAALLAARIVQGIGAGLILSCGPALATSLFPEAMRTRILARYMTMFGIGWALGPSRVRRAGGAFRLERGVQLPGPRRAGGVRARRGRCRGGRASRPSRSTPPAARCWRWR